MNARSTITIYKPNGTAILTTAIESGSVLVQDLMQNDYVKLVFSSGAAYRFGIGTYVDISSDRIGGAAKRYVLNGLAFPTYDQATGGYKYELQFDAWYKGWQRHIFTLVPTYGCVQTTFSYTNTIVEHVKLIFQQLAKLVSDGDNSIVMPSGVGLHYNGRIDRYVWNGGSLNFAASVPTTSVSETSNEFTFLLTDDMKTVQYDGVNINDAIGEMCKEGAFNCEWWVDDDRYLHFGRCEFGSGIELKHHVDFEDLQRAASSDQYGTRLVAFGATTNVPSRYRKKLIFDASDVHTKNGYTHFTDAFRKPPIKYNSGRIYYGWVAGATIPHSQTAAIDHEYIDVLVDKEPGVIKKNQYFGRKTTNWQGRELYDCVERVDVYHDYRIVSYNVKAGDKIVISGSPTDYNGHYLFRYNGGSGNVYGDYITTSNDISEEIRPTVDCVVEITLSGTISVEYYESTYISYHRIGNVNELALPKIKPGRYLVIVDDLDYDIRINGEFRCEADRHQEVEIEVYDESVITIDIINNSGQYIDAPEFDIEIQSIDYYVVSTKAEILDGTSKGRKFDVLLNVDENFTSRRTMTGKELHLSENSFKISVSGTNLGIVNGTHFSIEGFNLEDINLSYFTDDYSVDTNISSYERRLMLPVDRCPKNYIDSPRIESPADVVTVVKTFDDIYPSQYFEVALVNTYTEKVTKTDDNGNTYFENATRFRFFIKKSDLDFKKAYIATGQTLQCVFQNGLCGGLTFDLEFEGNTQTKDAGGNSLQSYVIVNNSGTGIDIPNNTICPSVGDRLVLLNYNPMSLQDLGFVSNAEERLYEAAVAHLDKISLDAATYTMTLLSDAAEAICDAGSGFARIGQRVNIEHEAYFDEPRATRVIGIEQKLDIPWDTPVYKLGESLKYSRLKSIENTIKKS